MADPHERDTMSSSIGLGNTLSLPRADTGERRVAHGRMRRWVLIWLGCAALSWMATIVIGYTVIRFGDATSTDQRIEASAEGGEAITAEDLATVNAIAPAAGTAPAVETND